MKKRNFASKPLRVFFLADPRTRARAAISLIILFACLAVSSCSLWVSGTDSNGASTTTFSITYNANLADSGTVPVDAQEYKTGATARVAVNTGALARTGYIFAGWNSAADGSGTTYSAESSASFVMGSADVVLYALWQATGSIVYVANGATDGAVPVDDTVYQNGVSAPVKGNSGNLAQAGYGLLNWNTKPDGTGTAYAADGSATMAMTGAYVKLYAIWTMIDYTVTYDANGATGGAVPVPAVYHIGQTVAVPGNSGSLSLAGNNFGGWTTSTVSVAGASFGADGTRSFTIESANVTLRAVWIPTTYSFTSAGNAITITGTTAISAPALIVPLGVTALGDKALYSCAVSSITLPVSLLTIGAQAFSGDSNLASLAIPAGVTSIGVSVFFQCTSLKSLTVQSGNTSFMAEAGALYNYGEKTLIWVPWVSTFSVPASVTKIGDAAFRSITTLTQVTLPNGLLAIGTQAFCYSGLTAVDIPSSVQTIGDDAFASCSNLSSISIHQGTTRIGSEAFVNTALSSVQIPASVTMLGYHCFWNCLNLTSVTMVAEQPLGLSSGNNTFTTTATGFAIHVPSLAAQTAYRAAPEWSTYGSMIVTP